MLESKFKLEVYRDLEAMLPGCIIIANDASYIQGIPDTLVLYHQYYAMLEFKKTRTSAKQPNQRYYVELFDEWSFAAFIYPENKEDVLNALQRAFRS